MKISDVHRFVPTRLWIGILIVPLGLAGCGGDSSGSSAVPPTVPVVTPPVATPVATPPVATPPVATPPVATPPVVTPPAAMTVTMTDFSFSTKNVSVPVGTTVTWMNKGQAPHTSTSGPPGQPSGMWDSGTLNSGQSFSFKFTKAGTFPYYCQFHFSMGMVGTVTVK